MPRRYICTACRRTATSRPHCEDCKRRLTAARNAASPYNDPAYTRLRARLLADHRATHGDWCPGDQHHPPHPSRDLTIEHTTPLRDGGHITNQPLRVLCRQRNSGWRLRA